jgi:hypothetical protein
MTALLVLRNKAIKPLLAAAQPLHPARSAHNPKPIDAHYKAIRVAMNGVFHELPLEAWPFHVLLSVPLDPEQIEAIGAREGWRAKTFGRGMKGRKPFFHVIEFWLENRLMIEVVSLDMSREYEEFLKNAPTEIMGDPEAVRLMRATHVKEPA